MSIKTMNLHDIVSVDLGEIKEQTTNSGNTYHVRNIILLDKDGQEFRITLFGDARTNLAVEV